MTKLNGKYFKFIINLPNHFSTAFEDGGLKVLFSMFVARKNFWLIWTLSTLHNHKWTATTSIKPWTTKLLKTRVKLWSNLCQKQKQHYVKFLNKERPRKRSEFIRLPNFFVQPFLMHKKRLISFLRMDTNIFIWNLKRKFLSWI